MRKANLYASTALGLCLIPVSGVATAQSANVSAEELALFAPLVQRCIDAPATNACAPVRSIVAECAVEMTFAQCEVLFEDGIAVFDDPELVERVQDILQQVDTAMPSVLDQTGVGGALVVNDDVRIEAERQLLLGDENQLTHSTPPLLEGEITDELREALDDPLSDMPDDTPEEVAPEIEVPVEDMIEAPAPVDPELAAPEEMPTAAPEPLPVPEQDAADLIETAPVDPAVDADTTDDASATLETMRRLLESEPDAGSEAADSDVAPAEDSPDVMARVLEQERTRLLEESDAMAEDAPELVIEDLPQEELVAPPDAQVELDATQQAAIEQMMENPEVSSALESLGATLGFAAPVSDTADEAPAPEVQASAEEGVAEDTAEISEEQITREQLRSSRDDFVSRLALDFDADAQAQTQRSSSNRRDLERAGLVALGALAVGMIINQNRVVARSDERVVVDQGEGDLVLWRDDDAILQQDGSTRRIERFSDGSTRTRWQRTDGTQVVTIRDATGRVLRRERVLADGTIIELVDDLRPVQVIDVTILPPARSRELRITQRTDPDLALAMLRDAEAEARALDRVYSLRQIRETRELRELLPLLSPDPITFETNRANVRTEEATKLLQVGRLMERLIASDPREIFLIEGHTDATGPAAFNLALSDRRAESVALALTEFFNIPPENLIVQGYGERYLRIQTLSSEERNRRVAIRRITPLMNR